MIQPAFNGTFPDMNKQAYYARIAAKPLKLPDGRQIRYAQAPLPAGNLPTGKAERLDTIHLSPDIYHFCGASGDTLYTSIRSCVCNCVCPAHNYIYPASEGEKKSDNFVLTGRGTLPEPEYVPGHL